MSAALLDPTAQNLQAQATRQTGSAGPRANQDDDSQQPFDALLAATVAAVAAVPPPQAPIAPAPSGAAQEPPQAESLLAAPGETASPAAPPQPAVVAAPLAAAAPETAAAPDALASASVPAAAVESADLPIAPATAAASPADPTPPGAPGSGAEKAARAPQREATPDAKAPADALPLAPAAVDEAKHPAPIEAPPPRDAVEVVPRSAVEASTPPDPSGADTDGRAASQRHGGAALPSFAKQDESSFAERVARAAPAPVAGPVPEAAGEPGPAAHAAVVATDTIDVAAPIAADSSAAPAAASDRAAEPATRPPAEAVAARVEWLAERGGGTARVRLDPPSLGEIQIEVRVRDGIAEVVLHTSERATHAILAGERAAVTQILAGRDVRVDAFSVVHEPTPRGDPFAGGRDEQAPRDGSGQSKEGGGGRGDPQQPGRTPAGVPTVASVGSQRDPARTLVIDSRLDLRV